MLYYIYKVKENKSDSEVHIMRIYVVTEMIDLKVKRITGATADRERALGMACAVMKDRLRNHLDITDLNKYLAKENEELDHYTQCGINCIDTYNTVQITVFDD